MNTLQEHPVMETLPTHNKLMAKIKGVIVSTPKVRSKLDLGPWMRGTKPRNKLSTFATKYPCYKKHNPKSHKSRKNLEIN